MGPMGDSWPCRRLLLTLLVVLSWATSQCDKTGDPDSPDVDCSGNSFSGTDAKELQCLLDGSNTSQQLKLVSLVAHGESGFVWRGNWQPQRKNGKENVTESVIVKFRCCKDMCEGGRVCKSVVAGMNDECDAGVEAFRRVPQSVAACLELEVSHKAKPFIVLKDVGNYLNAQDSLEDFIRQDQLSNHLLMGQLLRAVRGFLDPAKDGKSLVHMDLTTANIMWDPRSLNVQLIDFSQVDFCSAVVSTRTGIRGHCLPKHYLKDLKKELVHLAVSADIYGNAKQHFCIKRVRQINFERNRAQRLATDHFVPLSIGKTCSSLISPWTWKFLTWMGHLDRHIKKLTASKQLIPVKEVFKVEEESAAWSLLQMSKIYS